MSAVYASPTSKPGADPTFYGQLRTTWDNAATVKIMDHDDTGSQMASARAYLERSAFADAIADDMHKELLAGMSHDAQGRAFYPQ